MKKNILIVGANFGNKGAQSMLFVTVDELKKRLAQCEIYFGGCEIFDENVYAFHELYYSETAKNIALKNNAFLLEIKCFLKDCVKFILGKRNNLFRFNEVKLNILNIDLIIDISGFNIGKKWSIEVQESYLNNIRLAKKYRIPMVIMPQSFGSFDYPSEKEYLLPEIKKLLAYPKIIFAREKEGYQMLIEKFGLTNVQLSTDLVLQNTGITISNIYNYQLRNDLPNVSSGAVAVIPNIQCFNHGDRDRNLNLYQDIIKYLINRGKKVYIFRHSREDLQICQMIAEQFQDKNIVLLDNEFSCLEYDNFVKQFEIIICSRFHGIVHAYRNYIPCILLGWAVKYQELALNVGQEQYAFDITKKDFSIQEVILALDNLLKNKKYESERIKEHVINIQKNNCFDQIVGWLK